MDFIYINSLLCFLSNAKLIPVPGLMDQVHEVTTT